MPRELSCVCEEQLADRVDDLAREYEIPIQEAVRQLIEIGLEEVDEGGVRVRER